MKTFFLKKHVDLAIIKGYGLCIENETKDYIMTKLPYMVSTVDIEIFNMAFDVVRYNRGLTPDFLFTTDNLDEFIVATKEGIPLHVDTVTDTCRDATVEEYEACLI